MEQLAIAAFNRRAIRVDEQFAFDYGEGERTLADWRRDNWDYLARWCAEIGRIPSEPCYSVVSAFACFIRK